MSRKINETKKIKSSSLSQEVNELNRLLVVGNNYCARKLAKRIIAAKTNEADHDFAVFAIRKTAPDPIALLTGLVCFSATVIVAFAAGY